MKTKFLLISIVLSLILFTGCNKSDNQNVQDGQTDGQEEVIETIPEINDYYGAYTRSVKVSDDMRNTLSASLQKCEEIQLSNPSDYWKEKNFASLTLNFLPVADLLQHTCFLNETQTFMQDEEGNILYDWESCKQYVLSTYPTENEQGRVTLVRNSPNNYSLTDWGEMNGIWGAFTGDRKTSAIYDSNHDWSQTLTYIEFRGKEILTQMLEYGRQKRNDDKIGFVLQTLKERAYIVYDKEGKLESFAYSRLNGNILTRYQERAFEILADHNRLVDNGNDFWSKVGTRGTTVSELTELVPFDDALGVDYTSYHLDEDSIYTHIDDITEEWVKELDPDFDLTITFDGKTLTVEFFNVLSKKIEEYIIHEDGSIDKSERVIETTSLEELLLGIEERWAIEDEENYLKETELNIDINGDGFIGKPPVEEETTETDNPTEETDGTGEKEEETVNDGDTE